MSCVGDDALRFPSVKTIKRKNGENWGLHSDRLGGITLGRMKTPYSEERKKRHRAYMAEWRKDERNRLAQNESSKKWQRKHGKEKHLRFVKENACSATTAASRKSARIATMARERWGGVEDAMLFSGKTEGQLVEALGRTIRAIQRRKWKLRQENKTT